MVKMMGAESKDPENPSFTMRPPGILSRNLPLTRLGLGELCF
jgi:hypothetical protein